ncbi:N-sulphoglucosamine sulphohydrolase-like [Liolophura sinensis]|uniref:N-sulphoglucosamine sulphohydrolase-like n=1 Tax=Liolophura sinensis TaxID=3198878 RepID=UPI003158FAD2
MYGLHNDPHHFNSFDGVRSLPVILGEHGIRTGIVGKKHVGPDTVYKFDYEETEENNSLEQVGRNITYMMEKIRPFLESDDTRPFFLYIGIHDPHRDAFESKNGPFANKFGNGEPGMGVIPDWKPVHYDPEDVIVPYFIPDTPAARADIAAQYTTMSRMDQGIGLFMAELEKIGHMDDTLVIYTSDNGIPWPNAKTNLYKPGMSEPMMVSSPLHKEYWGQRTESHASLLDVVPTVLDWFNVSFPEYKIRTGLPTVTLTGTSLLPVTSSPAQMHSDTAFGSHDFHEITMYYPMRVIKSGKYRLLQNLNYKMPFPAATDLFGSPTWMDTMNRTAHGLPTNWFKTLDQYYYRDEWELYDLEQDPMELTNLAYMPGYAQVLQSLQKRLMEWREVTQDAWRCFPSGVLETDNRCYDQHNKVNMYSKP